MMRVTCRSVCKCWGSCKWDFAVFGRKSISGKTRSFRSSVCTQPGYVLGVPVSLYCFALCVDESLPKLDLSSLGWFPLLRASCRLKTPKTLWKGKTSSSVSHTGLTGSRHTLTDWLMNGKRRKTEWWSSHARHGWPASVSWLLVPMRGTLLLPSLNRSEFRL